MAQTFDGSPFDNPDLVTQIEDEDPETLAGDDVDPDAPEPGDRAAAGDGAELTAVDRGDGLVGWEPSAEGGNDSQPVS